jgi:hypothetical protein
MEVTDRLQSTLIAKHIEVELEQRAQGVIKSFDDEFTNMLNIFEFEAQISHDANLFRNICQNIQNDLLSLDTCIKELQRCQQVGKVLYIKCTLSHKLTKYLDRKIQGNLSEMEALTSQIQQTSCIVNELEGPVASVHIDIRKLELEKEIILRRLSEFRESISLKISSVERDLEECVKAKDTYANFTCSNLNVVKIASYTLCTIVTTVEVEKDTWDKGMNILKENFYDCMKILAA